MEIHKIIKTAKLAYASPQKPHTHFIKPSHSHSLVHIACVSIAAFKLECWSVQICQEFIHAKWLC